MLIKINILIVFITFITCCAPTTDNTVSQKNNNEKHTPVPPKIPLVFNSITYNSNQLLTQTINGETYTQVKAQPGYTLNQLIGAPRGTKAGLEFNFGNNLNGTLYYGLIDYTDSQHPMPVYYKNPAAITNGKAIINFAGLQGKRDMVNWERNGYGTLGYRVTDAQGNMLYDGKITFSYQPNSGFKALPTIIEGPFVALPTPHQVSIWFKTNQPAACKLQLSNRPQLTTPADTTFAMVTFDSLQPNTTYTYTLSCGPQSQTYHFSTPPAAGTKHRFKFAYASDSRGGQGGGERDFNGTNAYIVKKIMALATAEGCAFMQFSGDLVTGYATNPQTIEVQYANWKNTIAPFAHHMPVFACTGNHEAVVHNLQSTKGNTLLIPQFPFNQNSAEAVFNRNFVNFTNGPQSEDGGPLDPDTNTINFPTYKENVFYYTWGNVAFVVLNSDYLYTPTLNKHPQTGGNLHAYIMPNQMQWLKKTIANMEQNPNIEHIFVTMHTPLFPNGGHVEDDMWYNGNNQHRPIIAGKAAQRGIIENRDYLLDICVNQSTKVRAFLTGDEHNYNKVKINDQMPRYPKNYQPQKTKLNRTVYQINNGAAGAPYYAQQQTPWSSHVSGFSTQNALVVFSVDGPKLTMKVRNPDTLEPVDSLILK